jgi:uncharacterized MnhB-related membrane protein
MNDLSIIIIFFTIGILYFYIIEYNSYNCTIITSILSILAAYVYFFHLLNSNINDVHNIMFLVFAGFHTVYFYDAYIYK